jgi:hypothetical protein
MAAATGDVAGPRSPGRTARLVAVTAPAEKPAATIASGSIPYSAVCSRSHATAATASS